MHDSPIRTSACPINSYFCRKWLIPSKEPSTVGRTMSTTTNVFWPKAKTLLPAVRYMIIDIRSRFSSSFMLSSSSLPTGHFVLVLGVNAGMISEVRTSLPKVRTVLNPVHRQWQFPSRSRVEIDDSLQNTSARHSVKGFL